MRAILISALLLFAPITLTPSTAECLWCAGQCFSGHGCAVGCTCITSGSTTGQCVSLQ